MQAIARLSCTPGNWSFLPTIPSSRGTASECLPACINSTARLNSPCMPALTEAGARAVAGPSGLTAPPVQPFSSHTAQRHGKNLIYGRNKLFSLFLFCVTRRYQFSQLTNASVYPFVEYAGGQQFDILFVDLDGFF